MAINPVMADTPTRSPKGPWKCPGKDASPTIFYDGEVKNGLLSGAPRAGHEWQAPKGCFCAGEERSHLLFEGERPSENCKVVRTCQWARTPAAASTNERAALHLSDQYVSGVSQRGARIAGNGRALPVRWWGVVQSEGRTATMATCEYYNTRTASLGVGRNRLQYLLIQRMWKDTYCFLFDVVFERMCNWGKIQDDRVIIYTSVDYC